jgi:putative RNA 2'-phosphotransferase
VTQRLVKLSKLLSLMLRHEPARFGLVLDAEGFAPLAEVVRAAQASFPDATEADLMAIVQTIEADKRRFAIEDGEIRANYGHSFAERIAQAAKQPPHTLCHGTHETAVATILSDGLMPMRRQYVHMTPNIELARRVGSRRGTPVLLEVDARAAHADGIVFYQANESFWLADHTCGACSAQSEAGASGMAKASPQSTLVKASAQSFSSLKMGSSDAAISPGATG